MKFRNALHLVLVVSILVFMCGCIAAYVGGLAVDAIGGIENTKVNAAVSPGVTKAQLSDIKRIVFLFSEDKPATEILGGGGLTDILSDNIAIEMMKIGFECIETEQLKAVLEEQGTSITGPLDIENALKAAKKLGVQAIITGNIKSNAAYKSSAAILSGKVTSATLIQTTTLKILGATNGQSLMVISISYKNGQKPDSAAKSMVKILKAKIDDPLGVSPKNKK